jgi:hypothetical protein
MTFQIPLQPIPNQTVSVVLGTQFCQINIYQKEQGLFMDVNSDNKEIASGVICRDRNFIVRYPYRGFKGDLSFVDLNGKSDPYYLELNSRWVLIYVEPI